METLDDQLQEARVGTGPDQIVLERLSQAPLFEGIDRREVAKILAVFDDQHFNAGHRVTLEGFRGSEFYIITEGWATVVANGATVGVLGPGDFFGEMAVLGDGLRSASVIAETPLRCLVLANNALAAVLETHPKLGVSMLHEVISRYKGAVGSRPQREVPAHR